MVGLVTFGTNVVVHELGFADCPKSYVFRGTKEYAAVKVKRICEHCLLFCYSVLVLLFYYGVL